MHTKAVFLIAAAGLAAAAAGWMYQHEPEVEVHALRAGPSRTVVREVPPTVLLEVPDDEPVETQVEPEAQPAEAEPTPPTPSPQTSSVPLIQQAEFEPVYVNEDERPRKVTGIVVDLDGKPVEAHISMVNDGGSVSMSSGKRGDFEFDPSTGEVVLIAHTEDGRVGILNGLQLEEGFGRSDLSITVQPGAELQLNLEGGKESVRCALSQGSVLFNDFTLRSGKAAREIVPPGLILVRLYEIEGSERIVLAEQAVHLAAGGSESLSFELH